MAWHMVGIWKMEERYLCHQEHTFTWISNAYILLSIFLVFLASKCLKKKLHTSFPPNQGKLCEIHKDGRGRKEHSQIRKKVFFFFSFCIRREFEKEKKWEAKKDKGVKPVYLKKKLQVGKQLSPANFSWSGFKCTPDFWTIA